MVAALNNLLRHDPTPLSRLGILEWPKRMYALAKAYQLAAITP